MSWTGFYRHENGTDTLYAMPLATGAFTATGIVVGSDTDQDTLYTFADLDDSKTYEIRVRAGGSPAAGDVALSAIGNVPSAAENATAVWEAEERTLTSGGGGDAPTVEEITEEIERTEGLLRLIYSRTQATSSRWISAFDSTTQTLVLIQHDDYVEGSARGPIKLPLPDLSQVLVDDVVYLQISVDDNKSTDEGVVILDTGVKYAYFEIKPLTQGVGFFEVDHIDANGKQTTFFRDDRSKGSPIRILPSVAEVPE